MMMVPPRMMICRLDCSPFRSARCRQSRRAGHRTRLAALPILVGLTALRQRRAEDFFEQPRLSQARSRLECGNLRRYLASGHGGRHRRLCSSRSLLLRRELWPGWRRFASVRFPAQSLRPDHVPAQLVRPKLAIEGLIGIFPLQYVPQASQHRRSPSVNARAAYPSLWANDERMVVSAWMFSIR
jgi:hypothetical protein